MIWLNFLFDLISFLFDFIQFSFDMIWFDLFYFNFAYNARVCWLILLLMLPDSGHLKWCRWNIGLQRTIDLFTFDSVSISPGFLTLTITWHIELFVCVFLGGSWLDATQGFGSDRYLIDCRLKWHVLATVAYGPVHYVHVNCIDVRRW